jgi:hypothetical protein
MPADPCRRGELCLGEQGDECRYFACVDGELTTGSGVACQASDVEPIAGGPFLCDPSQLPSDLPNARRRRPGTVPARFTSPPKRCDVRAAPVNGVRSPRLRAAAAPR